MVAIYRPKSREWWLARSPLLVRECVKAIDDEAGHKVLLSYMLNGAKGKGLRLWALQMQTIPHSPNGNYLHKYFLSLHDDAPEVAKKLVQLVLKEGVAVSSTSGHFNSLEHLDPREGVPAEPVNKSVLDVPAGRFVDAFTSVKYDESYLPRAKGVLSEVLQLKYADGSRVDLDIRLICDNIEPALGQAFARAYLGPGGLIYPLRLTRNAAPKLWRAKNEVALAAMHKSNDEFAFFVELSMAGIFSNLPTGPVVGPVPPVETAPVRGGRVTATAPEPTPRGATLAGETAERRATAPPPSGKPPITDRMTTAKPPPSPPAPTVPSGPGYPAVHGEVLGDVPKARLPSAPFGTVGYGQQIEPELVRITSQRFPRTRFKFGTGPGGKGSDVTYMGGDDPGFDIADFKPDSSSGYAKFVAQVRRLWSGGPMAPAGGQFRAAIIQYQENGTVFVGDIAIAGRPARPPTPPATPRPSR